MIGDRYAHAAPGWATGAAHVYRPLAEALVAASPHPLAGRRVLDAGAGTGLVSRALQAVGARPVALDVSPAMLGWDAEDRPPAVIGTVTALPLRAGSVDDAVAAFVLNHVSEPDVALAELVRAIRPGGAVLATVYASSQHSEVRDRIDAVTADHGFVAPDWYAHLKTAQAPLLGDAASMDDAARGAGLVGVRVDEGDVDVGLDRPADLVDYRLGQAHAAAWLAGLDTAARTAVRDDAVTAVTPVMRPYRPRVVRLVAQRPPGSPGSHRP